MMEAWLRKICKFAFGVQDDRKQELVQYKEYEIYLFPRQEGVWDVGIYKYNTSVNQKTDIILSRDEIVRCAKEWIDENDKWNIE